MNPPLGKGSPPLIIAHRGCLYPGYNQNTIRAFRRVIEEGATAIEFDVHCTRDGELFVLHDYTLDHISTGTGAISEQTADYMHSLWAGDPQIGEDAIPTLADLLEMAASYPPDRRPLINIEMKGAGTGETVSALLIDWLSSNRLIADDLLISSFARDELISLQSHLPDVRISLLQRPVRHKSLDESDTIYLKRASEMGAYSLSIWHGNLFPGFMEICHREGLSLFVYTPNSTEEIERVVDMGVDGLFTDFWNRAHPIVESRFPKS